MPATQPKAFPCDAAEGPGQASAITLQHDLAHLGWQGRRQAVIGPMQDDEALLLFAVVRALGVRRILEVGGLNGFTATNFIAATRCHPGARVYTVDTQTVASVGKYHRVLQKSAADLVAKDINHTPVDLLLLDCHNFTASVRMLKRILSKRLLSANGIVALHDTGLHAAGLIYMPGPGGVTDKVARGYSANTRGGRSWQASHTVDMQPASKKLLMHQPVERLISQWLEKHDAAGAWQRLVVHDDHARGATAYRHGLTIMQRKQSLWVPPTICKQIAGKEGPATWDECNAGQVDREPWSRRLQAEPERRPVSRTGTGTRTGTWRWQRAPWEGGKPARPVRKGN